MQVLVDNFPFVIVALLIGVGLYVLLFKRNLVKIVMGIVIISSAVNLFLVTLGYRQDGVAPIFTLSPEGAMALPVVQALTLTNIVIGVSVVALMLALIIRLFRRSGNIDSKSRMLKG